MSTNKSMLLNYSETYKPFHYPWAVDVTIEHERMHWHEGEVELTDDVTDWKLGKVTSEEKNFIIQILRMFTQSDVNVGRFYLDHLTPVFKNNEVRNMLASFASREGTHQRAYALLNDTLGLPDSDYSAFLEYEEMAAKHEFMLDASHDSHTHLAFAMAKSVMNEGVSLFASFVMLLNFQRRGLMKGMGKVVEWSVKDESKHVEGIARLFRAFVEEHPRIVNDDFKSHIYETARICVALEDKFIDLAFAMGAIEGVTPEEIKEYVRYIADRRLVQLGLKENWAIERNPLPWVDIILNAPDHTNFFENRVAEYEVATLDGEWDYSLVDYTVYGKEGCPYCAQAKELLERLGYTYKYVDLTDDEVRQAFYDENNFEGKQRTVPKIYYHGEYGTLYVGGYTELAASIK